MAARGAAGERMAAMEAASAFGRIGLAQGLGALHAAMLPRAPSCVGVVPVQWHRALSGDSAPAFLSAMTPRTAHVAPAEAAQPIACALSLASVLEMVRRTAGGAVDADAPLMEAGVDSLGAVELRNQLQQAAGGTSLPSTLVFDHPTARGLATLLEPERTASGEVARAYSANVVGGAVSVDGLSLRLPSSAASPHAAHRMLSCGSNAIAEVPATRWDPHSPPVLPARRCPAHQAPL